MRRLALLAGVLLLGAGPASAQLAPEPPGTAPAGESAPSAAAPSDGPGALVTRAQGHALAAQFILPDEGHFDEVAGDLAGVLADYDADRTSGAELVVPRFQSRFHVELPEVLRSLGLGALFDEEGQLLGIAPDERLKRRGRIGDRSAVRRSVVSGRVRAGW